MGLALKMHRCAPRRVGRVSPTGAIYAISQGLAMEFHTLSFQISNQSLPADVGQFSNRQRAV